MKVTPMNLRLRPFSTSLTLSLLLAASTAEAAAPVNRVRVPTGAPKNASPPSLAFSPSTLGLNALAGTYVEATASLVNSGSVGVVIKGIDLEYLGTGVTLDESCANKWLGPKESCKVRVGFNATQAGSATAGTVTARFAAGAENLVVETRAEANPATAKIYSLRASPEFIVANGLASTTLQAKVVDAYGNQMGAGAAVHWESTKGVLSAASSVTDAAGMTSVTLTSETTLGLATVLAKSASSGQGSSAKVQFVADALTASVSGLELDAAEVAAGGTVGITVKVSDAKGNPVEASQINFSTDSGLVSTPALTGSEGQTRAVWMPPVVAGTYSVTARATEGTGSMAKSVLVTANASAGKVTTLNSSAASVESGSTTKLTAKLQDSYGNPIQGGSITWTPSSGAVSGATLTNSSGQATATWKPSTVAGTYTVKATGVVGDTGASASVKVTAVTPPPAAKYGYVEMASSGPWAWQYIYMWDGNIVAQTWSRNAWIPINDGTGRYFPPADGLSNTGSGYCTSWPNAGSGISCPFWVSLTPVKH